MTDSENLARKRRGHRGSATRSMNTVEALEEPDPARLAQLKLSLEEKLTRLDSEILDLTENEHLEDENLESDEFKDGVYRRSV